MSFYWIPLCSSLSCTSSSSLSPSRGKQLHNITSCSWLVGFFRGLFDILKGAESTVNCLAGRICSIANYDELSRLIVERPSDGVVLLSTTNAAHFVDIVHLTFWYSFWVSTTTPILLLVARVATSRLERESSCLCVLCAVRCERNNNRTTYFPVRSLCAVWWLITHHSSSSTRSTV